MFLAAARSRSSARLARSGRGTLARHSFRDDRSRAKESSTRRHRMSPQCGGADLHCFKAGGDQARHAAPDTQQTSESAIRKPKQRRRRALEFPAPHPSRGARGLSLQCSSASMRPRSTRKIFVSGGRVGSLSRRCRTHAARARERIPGEEADLRVPIARLLEWSERSSTYSLLAARGRPVDGPHLPAIVLIHGEFCARQGRPDALANGVSASTNTR